MTYPNLFDPLGDPTPETKLVRSTATRYAGRRSLFAPGRSCFRSSSWARLYAGLPNVEVEEEGFSAGSLERFYWAFTPWADGREFLFHLWPVRSSHV